MAKRRTSRSGDPLFPEALPLKFDQRLVLLQWMLRLFDKKEFGGISKATLEKHHVLFQDDRDTYIGKMLNGMID